MGGERRPDRCASAEGDGALCCDIGIFDDDQRKRWELLHEWLQVGVCEIIELPDGYALWLDPNCLISRHVDEFMLLDRRCCSFVDIRVQEDPEHDGPVLVMSGGEGVKEFLAAMQGIGEA